MKRHGLRLFACLLAALACAFTSLAVAQTTVPPQGIIPLYPPAPQPRFASGEAYFDGAEPYWELSLKKLKKVVPQLRQLRPSISQAALPAILRKVGLQINAMLPEIPNLVAHEEIVQRVYRGPFSRGRPVRREYNYLILVRASDGVRTLVEHRTPIEDGAPISRRSFLTTTGFAFIWLTFDPANQAESRFRYLGTESVSGKTALVVGFCQRPGHVTDPSVFTGFGRSVPVLFQGIAWIDPSSYRVLRIRSDILAPLPMIHLRSESSLVNFAVVRVPQVAAPLWLPQTAVIRVDVDGKVFQNNHQYSDYQLFEVKSRILTAPPSAPKQ